MVFDDLAQVVCVQEFLDVEDAFHGGGVVSGAEEEVGESCVTEEQIAAEEVQCGVALLLLAWFHTKNCLEGGGVRFPRSRQRDWEEWRWRGDWCHLRGPR